MYKNYCYNPQKPDHSALQNLKETLSEIFPENSAQTLSFSKEKTLECNSVILLAEIEDLEIKQQKEIYLLGGLPVSIAQTLTELAKDKDNAGFAFLWERFKNGYTDGNILVSVKDNVINGAIGPLQITKDAIGRITRFPPYFGVAKSSRKSGVGAALWHAGLAWAKDRGAEYIIIQAQHNSPAEKFYQKIGLKELGGIIRS